jgi:hypothetical protein
MPYDDELDFGEDQAAAPAVPPGVMTVDPSRRGRMYMGPALSPAAESQFMNSGVLAGGLRVAPPAPVGPPAMAIQDQRAADLASVPGAQNMGDVDMHRRVVAATPPGDFTMSGISRPEPPPPDQEMMAIAQKMGAPLNQAIQAIESQRRYQAQRGYQADIKAGMPAAEAMTKWGPLLFAGPKGAGAMPKMAGPGLPGKPFQFHQGPEGSIVFNPNTGSYEPIPGLGKSSNTVTERTKVTPGKPAIPATPPGPGLFGTSLFRTPGTPGVPAVPERSDVIGRTTTQRAPVVAPPAPPPAAAPATTATGTNSVPFKEGQIIRDKKTGKRYRVQNGEPVPI